MHFCDTLQVLQSALESKSKDKKKGVVVVQDHLQNKLSYWGKVDLHDWQYIPAWRKTR